MSFRDILKIFLEMQRSLRGESQIVKNIVKGNKCFQ